MTLVGYSAEARRANLEAIVNATVLVSPTARGGGGGAPLSAVSACPVMPHCAVSLGRGLHRKMLPRSRWCDLRRRSLASLCGSQTSSTAAA